MSASNPSHSATVARVDRGGCVLLGDDDGVLEAIARGALMGPRKSLGNTVVVGDRVQLERDDERWIVRSVDPRRNAFSRRASGKHPFEQVVAANLDQVVVVASLERPDFKPGFADRVLGQAEHAGIPARLVANKLDMAGHDKANVILEDYAAAGYPVHAVSAKTGEGVSRLHHACLDRRSLFVGHSGVGKSTLLNALVPGLNLLVGKVNPKTGKGRHTTTAAWLVRPQPGFELIDTPGVRTFGLWGIGPRDLEQAYIEFRRYIGSCRFSDCQHQEEPDCAVRKAVAEGKLPVRRYESFLKLRDEIDQESTTS